MQRIFLLSLAILAAWAGGLFAQPAEAKELVLDAHLCVGGADSAHAALTLTAAELDCSESRFANRKPFVRTHADIGAGYHPSEEELVWQTDPSKFDSMVLYFAYADGTKKLVDVDPQMAVRNWFVQTRFTVPVPQSDAALRSIDVVVERPRTSNTLSAARLVGKAQADEEHYSKSLLYALLCGLLIVPIIYDLLFFRILRHRFMIWHAFMTAGLLAFVVSNTGLLFRLFPEVPLGLRYQLNTLSLALATAAAVFFVKDLLEDGTVAKWLGKATIGFTALMLVLKAVTLFDLEALRMWSNTAFLLSMAPLAICVLAIIATAAVKGSRSGLLLLIAFAAMGVGGLIRLLKGTGLYNPPFHLDDFLMIAIAVLVIGTSAAVGDRIMVLRMERDRARASALKLGRMAMTDPLTGLANRRAFQAIERLQKGHALLVADIDHFKAINDREGHAVGDAVLCHMASVMRDTFEDVPMSTIYRLGGEEFALIFECKGDRHLRSAAEQLRKAIDRSSGHTGLGIPRATISVGASMGRGQTLQDAFVEADQALYLAKQEGRNRSAVTDREGRIAVIS